MALRNSRQTVVGWRTSWTSLATVRSICGRFPAWTASVEISTGGGTEPVWNPDPTKRELFYRNGQDMMAVQIDDQGSAESRIEKLFSGPYASANGGYARANYDVFPDGSFLMLKPAEQHGPLTQINVVLGWSEEVKRRAPAPAR